MPNCTRCGKGPGFLGSRSFSETTGRCYRCHRVVEEELERFRLSFRKLVEHSKLTNKDWTAFETELSERGLDFNEALAFISDDVISLITETLEERRELNAKIVDERDEVEHLVQSLALPEYFLEIVQSLVSKINISVKNAAVLGEGNAAILCIRCGAGVVGLASAADFNCSACGFVAVIRRCPACSIPVHIQQDLWGRSVKCLKCGCQNSWRKWNAYGVTLGELSKNYSADQEHIADPNRRIITGVVIGGAGYAIPARVGCKLEFTSDKVIVHALFDTGQYQPVAVAEYLDVMSLQVGGRGAVTTGGGWSGGGFGLSGVITGALLAGALNKATTKTNIETIIHFRTRAGELVILNTQYTPDQLAVMVSPVIARIEAVLSTPSGPPADPISQLRELAELRSSGTINEEEFQQLKANVLKTVK